MTIKKFVAEKYDELQEVHEMILRDFQNAPYINGAFGLDVPTRIDGRMSERDIILSMMYLEGEIFLDTKSRTMKTVPKKALLPLTPERIIKTFDIHTIRERVYRVLLESNLKRFQTSNVIVDLQPLQQPIWFLTKTLLHRVVHSAILWHVKNKTMPIEKQNHREIFTLR